ncbi:MAG: Alanine racemase [Parcubacteria group bacterium GW2011_GWB1_56_8]|nr:MAG: Alanine racemase [Parcubacteria group bacterium GW2011_GWB1_56_8]
MPFPRLRDVLRFFSKPRVTYAPLIEVRIAKDRLLRNLEVHQRAYPRLEFAPVLKSNAYGHGLIEVARVMETASVPFLVVDSFYEALKCRQHSVRTPILVIGYSTAEQWNQAKVRDCSFTIVSTDHLRAIASGLARPQKFHLKIDTGMCRQGILPGEINSAVHLIKQSPHISVEGACSHFSDADGADEMFTMKQIAAWNAAAAELKKEFPGIRYLHIAATPGLRWSRRVHANVCRLGMGLYGMNPLRGEKLPLAPALRMTAKISGVKTVPAGSKIGYGRTATASREMRLVTIPAGYFEGVDRRLSNKGAVKVRGKFLPIAGRVSMNITTADATSLPDVRLEEEAILISEDPADQNSIERIAGICGTIPYDIAVRIPPHLRRIMV